MTKKKEKRYNYTYGHKGKVIKVCLEDGTEICFFTDKMSLNIAYPKELIEKIIAKTKKDSKDSKHYRVYWDCVELRAMLTGFRKCLKDIIKEEKKGKKILSKEVKKNGSTPNKD